MSKKSSNLFKEVFNDVDVFVNNMRQDIALESLNPQEFRQVRDIMKTFGVYFNGYTNGKDDKNGYMFTDTEITRTTFTTRSLDFSWFSKAYINKIKQFYPETWKSVLDENIVNKK